MKKISNIILSRTDSIGDMVLTLPMAKIIKDYFPDVKVFFLGREYTRPVVDVCIYADGFIELNDFLKDDFLIDNKPADAIVHVKPLVAAANHAKKLKIKWRIGTTNRIFHWNTCNKLIRLSRKNSNLHEAQLNLKLLSAFGIKKSFSFEDISNAYGFTNLQALQPEYAALIDHSKYNIILHPKSRGNAREWDAAHFIALIEMMDEEKFNIFISGTDNERAAIEPILQLKKNNVHNIVGNMQLKQFMSFIAACDGLLAASTGPLHIAAASGIDAFGLYPPIRPMHAGRWGPIGKNAQVFQLNTSCKDCYKQKMQCHCIEEISPFLIKQSLDKRITN